MADAAAKALGHTLRVYNLECYSFGSKDVLIEKDASVAARLARMKEKYAQEGMRRSVEAVLIVQQHNHPHVLLLQIGNTFFKLPGGHLKPGEGEIDGLARKLSNKLGAPGKVTHWEIGELACTWWRPHFETFQYPFIPPHITRPKECKKLFVVQLPRQFTFHVPKNLKLIAVPLFELYDNPSRFGPIIASLPQALSRFNFVYI
eukprot:CAMPEP_0177654878 /NCGR_PEP_ID=MMETSP0447-20121125/14601_1 /TAXON_ID=0 /ORGANISM="Stygamoeba regulata, Strain BSH-02190019" /LENGTH=202 /DNA_ID=CAMNT_0019158625 /DNA_START=107 /DNA_END=715 /DNA_ORIENTATION=-